MDACSPTASCELSCHNGPFSRKRPEIHSNPQDVKEIGVRVRPGMLRLRQVVRRALRPRPEAEPCPNVEVWLGESLEDQATEGQKK